VSLRATAEADLAGILEDSATGFGFPITVTDPAGLEAELIGFSNDIASLIDPETGTAITGRLASVALRISSLIAAGYTTLPQAIQDGNTKPWLVQFDDINGNPFTFKVQEGNPDRALGVITCLLEAYGT
jgi:hypothetical protein